MLTVLAVLHYNHYPSEVAGPYRNRHPPSTPRVATPRVYSRVTIMQHTPRRKACTEHGVLLYKLLERTEESEPAVQIAKLSPDPGLPQVADWKVPNGSFISLFF